VSLKNIILMKLWHRNKSAEQPDTDAGITGFEVDRHPRVRKLELLTPSHKRVQTSTMRDSHTGQLFRLQSLFFSVPERT
jgi:hypothetical protein